MFLYKPADTTGEGRKFARPFHGPYRLMELGANTAKIRRVDRPEEEPVLVSIDRLRRCPREFGEGFWPPDRSRKKKLHIATEAITAAEKLQTSTIVPVQNHPEPDQGTAVKDATLPTVGVMKRPSPTQKAKLTEGEQCPDQTGELDCPVQGTEPNQLLSSPGHEIPPSMPEPAVTVEDLETPNSGLEGVGTEVVVGCSGGDNSKRIEETTCAQVDTSERSKLTTTIVEGSGPVDYGDIRRWKTG